jgi:hypothetical protein
MPNDKTEQAVAALRDAVAAESEACAQLAEWCASVKAAKPDDPMDFLLLAALIRKRTRVNAQL